MNTIKVLLIAAQVFFVNVLVAQNLTESLGGVRTNFQIVTGDVDLNASDQFIIQRGVDNHFASFSSSYGYGAGYQSFHLEFVAEKELKVEPFKYRTGRDNESKLELVFYSSNNTILALITVPFEYVNIVSNNTDSSLFFYSINLKDIPIVLLEKTSKIEMTKKEANK